MADNGITIYCDGGSRGNPGRSACAFVVEEKGKDVFSLAKYLGIATNNLAEYNAVLLAVKWLEKNKDYYNRRITFILDSELVVKQINGDYKIKNPKLKNIYLEINNILKIIPTEINFINVSREKNKKPDYLLNQKLDGVL